MSKLNEGRAALTAALTSVKSNMQAAAGHASPDIHLTLSPVVAEKVRAILAGLGAPEGELPEFMMESDFRAVAEVASAIEKAQGVQNIGVLERVRADLNALIDANNDIENTTPHASPEMRGAQRRGTALRNALMALKDAD